MRFAGGYQVARFAPAAIAGKRRPAAFHTRRGVGLRGGAQFDDSDSCLATSDVACKEQDVTPVTSSPCAYLRANTAKVGSYLICSATCHRRAHRLQVFRCETCVLGNPSQHTGANFVAIVERENEIGPTLAVQRAV